MLARHVLLGSMTVAGLVLASTAGDPASFFTAAHRKHWSLQKLTKPDVPAPKRADLIRNPIDAFVQGRLEARGLSLSGEADLVTLLRRVSFDLTGLPPTPEEVDAVTSDSSPGRLREGGGQTPSFSSLW